MTLTQGLLFVAYNGIIDNPEIRAVSIAVGILGALLALMWIFFEQRNHIFFKGRAHLLRSLEAEIETRSGDKFKFFGLWTTVPQWVKQHAKWYEAASAQSILRFWVPLLFAMIWSGVVYVEVQRFIASDNTEAVAAGAVTGDSDPGAVVANDAQIEGQNVVSEVEPEAGPDANAQTPTDGE